MPVLQASNEPTATARATPQSSPVRDKRPKGSGFSSFVDDNAAKADAPRTRETQDISMPSDADRKTAGDAARAADALGASKPPNPVSGQALSDISTRIIEVDTPDTGEVKPASATPTLPPDTATVTDPPVKPDAPLIAPMPAPAAAATPVPVPVAIPMPAPQQVQAATPQPAQAPAPLAIAAAGLAAAKAVTAKSPDGTKTNSIPTDPTVTTETPADPDALPAADEAATPKQATPVKGKMTEIKLPAGFTPPDSLPDGTVKTDTPQPPSPVPAPATETKVDSKPDAKPEPIMAEGKQAAPAPDSGKPAAPSKTEHLSGQTAAAAVDFTGTAPQITGPQPAHHTVTAPAPTVQFTAAVATAQPVPLGGLAVELAARATSGATRFEIRLDPAELGRIDVRIDIDKHGQVTSHLTVEKPETLAMLRQDSPHLQRALNDAGFKTADGAMQFSLGDQSQSQAQQQNTDNGQRHAHRLFIQDDDMAAPSAPIRDYGRLAAARSGVDISV